MSDENADHEASKTREIWTFAGERVGSDGKRRVHVWVDEAGKELFFKAGTAYTIGGRYEVHVDRKDDGGVSLYNNPSPRYVERSERAEVSVWQAADLAAKTRQAARRREARDARENTRLDNAIETLKTIAAGQRTAADRAAFVAHIIAEVSRAW